jgi:restriction system protein
MGHILMLAASFRAALSEDAGVRAGLTLTHRQMIDHLALDHELREKLTSDDCIRLSADAYASAVGDLLFAVGATAEAGMPTLAFRFMGRLTVDWRSVFSFTEILKLEAIAGHFARLQSEGNPQPNALVADLKSHFGHVRYDFLPALRAAMDEEIAFNPFYSRNVDSGDLVALNDLFKSEKLPLDQGHFINQSFINYLDANPSRLGDMNWRQFEGLTAEWFQRQGYEVEIGPGRNDGSVDLRIWQDGAAPGTPPTVIVQCKRQKSKVGKVIVKALHDDMVDENASSGLIVTTSDLEPGAAAVIAARSYPITTANRGAVHAWVRAMRKPSSGIVS